MESLCDIQTYEKTSFLIHFPLLGKVGLTICETCVGLDTFFLYFVLLLFLFCLCLLLLLLLLLLNGRRLIVCNYGSTSKLFALQSVSLSASELTVSYCGRRLDY